MQGGLRGAIIVAFTVLAVQAAAVPAGARVVAVPDPDAGRPRVVINWGDGTAPGVLQPYERNVRGGANVAGGDVNGDGRADIVVGPGIGVRAPVRVFDADGTPLASFFPFGERFRGGVFVAAGDVNGDGLAEIITGPGAGRGEPLVVFGRDGDDLVSFFAYGPSFRGGVHVAAGDFTGDGMAEIVTAPAGLLPAVQKAASSSSSAEYRRSFSRAPPEVRVFSYTGSLLSSFPPVDRPFRGGVSVAAGDFNNDGRVDIVAGLGAGGPPVVRLFPYLDDTDIVQTLMPYPKRFRGGVRVATGDVNGDGLTDLITGPGPGIQPVVRTFTREPGGPSSFLAFGPSYTGGVSVATGDVNGDGLPEILTSTEYLRLGTFTDIPDLIP